MERNEVRFKFNPDGTKTLSGRDYAGNEIERILTPEQTFEGWQWDELVEGKPYELSEDGEDLSELEDDEDGEPVE